PAEDSHLQVFDRTPLQSKSRHAWRTTKTAGVKRFTPAVRYNEKQTRAFSSDDTGSREEDASE
ncbi:hypothetical protein, partial [Bradyrhizobium elkanii]|uniref:hypothetical protein n=1 Tax=Bradyrhizobium elkanii TaxID=29448 RepID=UPI001BA53802